MDIATIRKMHAQQAAMLDQDMEWAKTAIGAMTDEDFEDLQKKIDQGVALAQQALPDPLRAMVAILADIGLTTIMERMSQNIIDKREQADGQ